jgi:hypothetical protein
MVWFKKIQNNIQPSVLFTIKKAITLGVSLILYTYIRMTHYMLFNIILLTYNVSISSTNYQLSHHPTIDKSSLHHDT